MAHINYSTPYSNHRLSEPTFRNPNFSARSAGSPAHSTNSSSCQNSALGKTTSLDYRTASPGPSNCSSIKNSPNTVRKIKCVFVGDAEVGKTSLIVSYTTNGYPKEYVPTAFDNFSVLVRVNDQPVQLQICDTAGQSGFDSLRPLCYPNADVFILCFSVVGPDSFYNLESKWLPEIRQHWQKPATVSNGTVGRNGSKTQEAGPQLVLVGTQSDRRTNVSTLMDLRQLGETVVTSMEAEEYQIEIGAKCYVECSALTQRNLKEVFDTIILTALKAPLDSQGVNKSKIERAKYNPINIPSETRNSCARKSFKKLREKLKRSNSVDSGKYTSVQVRRQLSSGRINHLGLSSNCDQQPQNYNPIKSIMTNGFNSPQKIDKSHHQENNGKFSPYVKKYSFLPPSVSTSRINFLFNNNKHISKESGENNQDCVNGKKVCKSFSENILMKLPNNNKQQNQSKCDEIDIYDRESTKNLTRLRCRWRKLLCMA